MIPYSDLVTALRNWRTRNGLPNFGPDVGAGSADAAPPPMMGSSFPPPSPLATRTTPPTPPPGGAMVMDVEDEIDAAELESEEIYENEGGDFAMAFGSQAPPAQLATDPGTNPSKFPPSAGYTEPGMTDPEAGIGFGTVTYDDDFAAEPAPATGGTRPGIAVAVGMDADTADELDDDAPKPSGKATKKKKR
jgi:hypothetical protein